MKSSTRLAGWLLATAFFANGPAATAAHVARAIEGWTVQVNERLLAEQKDATEKALDLLRAQLAEVVRVVPPGAVTKLREVTLWFSPEYPGIGPKAEYHPAVGWLRANQRDPAMAKGIEFTNIRIFPAETRRMPNFALHELAHAYHDRVLGFERVDIKAAYEKAKAGGTYDQVERQDSEGRKRLDRAYAMVNHKEYFAELTEAFFTRNDFFPYHKAELEKHDPEMFKLLDRLWNSPATR